MFNYNVGQNGRFDEKRAYVLARHPWILNIMFVNPLSGIKCSFPHVNNFVYIRNYVSHWIGPLLTKN